MFQINFQTAFNGWEFIFIRGQAQGLRDWNKDYGI